MKVNIVHWNRLKRIENKIAKKDVLSSMRAMQLEQKMVSERYVPMIKDPVILAKFQPKKQGIEKQQLTKIRDLS